jgi:SAM-dependent methyltransferase
MPYGSELARIHHALARELVDSAEPFIAGLLPREKGLVVDAGCGGGVLARALTDRGFDVLGFDPSRAMIELARSTAPQARFDVASFQSARLPSCVAVCANGEVLNHGSLDDVRVFFARVAAVAPLFIFDVAERGVPLERERRFGGEDWSVIVSNESDGVHVRRRVLTFRNADAAVVRSEETHELRLHDRGEILAALRGAGFRARVRRSYGSRRLPKGYAVYVCLAE